MSHAKPMDDQANRARRHRVVGVAPALVESQRATTPVPALTPDAMPRCVVHVVDSLEIGGLERVVTDLAMSQQASGSRVSVFSICDTDGFRSILEAAGVPVVLGGKRGTFDLHVLRSLRAHVLARGAQVVHTHNFVPNYYAAAALLGAGGMRALVNTCHNMGSRLGNRRLRWLYRLSLTRTARVAMVARQVHERMIERGIVAGAAAVTVLNGVPVQRHAGVARDRGDIRASLGLGTDDLVLGCVGRLVELKNHEMLLNEVPALLSSFPHLKVVLVGEGPLESRLRDISRGLGIDDQVRFLGVRTDVPDVVSAMDVFVMPSRTEGMSVALLEACASGAAIVATAVGGNPEIVQDGVTGVLVGSGDGQALQAALLRLLRDSGLRLRLGQAARAWVQANGSVDAMRCSYEAVYRDALHSRAPAAGQQPL